MLHHFAERREVGGTALRGHQHGSHITGVPGSEDAGAYDREHLRVDAMIVVEAGDDSAREIGRASCRERV